MLLKLLKTQIFKYKLRSNKYSRKEKGKIAEEFASLVLELKGYKILKRNLFFKRGEIDIVAVKNKILYVFEVKFRKGDSFGKAEEAIDLKKRDKLYKISQSLNLTKFENINLKLFYINLREDGKLKYGIIDF